MKNFKFVSIESFESVILEFANSDSSMSHVQVCLINILKYLIYHHSIKSILVEYKYIDKDYTNELSNLYSKTFRSREGYCTRLHFFKDSYKDFDDFLIEFEKDNFVYKGFMVMRPLEVGKVGHTVIEPAELENTYYLCVVERIVHIFGKAIKAVGIPFIEQDSMVITCAQASLWICLKYLHFKHFHPRHLPFEITKSAHIESFTGRILPSSGLTIDQIMAALNNMDSFPILYQKPEKNDFLEEDDYRNALISWNPLEIVYNYIESEIPVLLSLKHHIFTVVGHKLADNHKFNIDRQLGEMKKIEEKEQNENFYHPSIISSSVFTDCFIVHDDTQGPYRLLPVDELNDIALRSDGKYSDFMYDNKINLENNIDSIIIPLPDKIYLLGEHVYNIAKKQLLDPKILEILLKHREEDEPNPYAAELTSSLSLKANNPVVLRTYFIRAVEFQNKVKKNININKEVRKKYLEMSLPRFIWIAEVSTQNIYAHKHEILGEMIFDSTGNKYDYENVILSIHLPGIFRGNKKIYSTDINDYNLSVEEPYVIKHRDNNLHCCIIE